MLAQHRPRWDAVTSFQLLAAVTSAAVATTVLVGWGTGTLALTRILSSSIAMNPMTAVAILSLSAGLLFRAAQQPANARWLGAVAALIGVAKLTQLAIGSGPRIDQLLFADQLARVATSMPNRMAPNTAFSLAMIGLGLTACCSKRPAIVLLSQLLCMFSALTTAAALVGYTLNEVALYQINRFIAMALSTALVIFGLSVAIITTNRNAGLMRIFGDRGPAGSLARVAIPLAVMVPVGVSMICVSGVRANYYGIEAAVAIALLANVLMSFVLLGGCTIALFRSDLDRRQRELSIARSESQYRQAEAAGRLGYWKLELPGKAVDWSDGFVHICDLPEDSPRELRTLLAVFHPDDVPMVTTALAQAEQRGVDWEFACRVRRADGSIRYVKSYGVCERDEHDRTIEVFGVFSDVTDLESARRDAEAAKATTASFLANMSHEIRTPMNGVMGFIELLLETDLDEVQRRHTGLIQNSANALLKLLNDILDISKIEAGRLEIAQAPYNAPHGIKQCVRLMNPIAQQKGLSLSLSIAKDVPTHLLVDGLRLRQILLNLIGNAIKFTPRGYVAVKIARATGPDGEVLRATVEDTGVGIQPDRIATVFDPFVQAERTTTRRFGGSGLGLSISRQLAEMMGGTIEVHSELGKGTRMTLVLPLVVSSAPAVSDSIQPIALPIEMTPIEPHSHRSSVLVVEDVDINQELFAAMLGRLGHKFEFASDGAEAVELAKRLENEPDAWDMIFMDLQMPVMDGLSAAEAIRAMGGRAATIPIVALTASAFEEDRQQCTAAGMNDHLAKPVGIEALRRMINRWRQTGEAPADDPAPPLISASLDRRIKDRLASSGERLTEVAQQLSDAKDDELRALMIEARTIAHMLAGTAGMVGEKAVGDLASASETTIAAWIDRNSAKAMRSARTAIEGLATELSSLAVPDQPTQSSEGQVPGTDPQARVA